MNLQKPRPRLLDKRAIKATKQAQWREVRRVVLKRDGNRCRACKRGGSLDAHHLLKRSQGGKDEANNLIAVCRECHDEIHGHVLIVRWKSDSNRAKTATFEWPYKERT